MRIGRAWAGIGAGVLMLLLAAMPAMAQYPSALVGFNDPPIDNPATAQDTFRIPQFSSTTSGYVVPNTVGAYDFNAAFRASGSQTEGEAALRVIFNWATPADADSWVRLTTFDGPVRPNPALHLGGKVRFKVTNVSEFFAGEVGLCIGIRETAADVAQLGNGGTTGTIEWVGTSLTPNAITAGPDNIVNTTAAGDDVQVYPVGTNIGTLGLPAGTAVITPGPNGVLNTTPAGDDQIRRGYRLSATGARLPIPAITLPPSPTAYAIEFNLATGQVTVDGTPVAAGIAGFTGDGVLSASPMRGTLEHIAITKVAGDAAILIDLSIDELQFEAPVPDPTPAPTIRAPVVSSDTQVIADCLPIATSAQLFRNGSPAGTVTPVAGVATFTGLTLSVGDVLRATQTANGLVSPQSAPVVVYAPGTALAENFDSYATQTALESIWTQTEPANARRVLLASGSASSCDNYVMARYGPGTTVSRLYFNLGSVNGTDAAPLRVTYRYKHDVNNTDARDRFELTSSLSRAYGAVGFAFTNGIGGAFATQYTSMTNSPTPIIAGYTSDYFNYDYALTGITRVPGVWHTMQIEVLSNVVNFYIDGVLANPIDPTSGVPLWPDGVPRVNNDPFRYIIIGTGYSTNGPAMMYDDIAVTIGNTPYPFGPPNPVVSPAITSALYPTGTSVAVGSIDVTATAVRVYVDDVLAATQAGPFPAGTATVTVPPLSDGAYVTATQTVGGIESCYSPAVVVAVPRPRLQPFLVPGQTQVSVREIEEGVASRVAVYQDNGEGNYVLLGTVNNPATDPVLVTVPALTMGQTIVATQTIGGIESAPSTAVRVDDPPAIAEWIPTSTLPLGLTGLELVFLNGYIYTIGGRSDASPQAVNNVYVARVNNDGSLGPWTATTSLPAPRAVAGAAAYNNRIYVWGGWDNNGFTTQNTCWYAPQNPDGTLGAWVVSAVTIPNSPAGQSQMDAFGRGILNYEDTLFIINGEDNSGTNQNICYYSRLTPAGDYGPWIPTSTTPNASWFHGAAVIEGPQNWLYRVAGNYRGTTERDMYRAVINPDGSLGAWTRDPSSLSVGRYEHACTVADNQYIFVICGLSGSTPQNTVYYARVDPVTGSIGEWRTGPTYPLTVSRNAAVTYTAGGKLYVLVAAGGPYSGGPRTGACYYAQVITTYYSLADFANFQRCYNPTLPAGSACADAFDFNKDGFVNFRDYKWFEPKLAGP